MNRAQASLELNRDIHGYGEHVEETAELATRLGQVGYQRIGKGCHTQRLGRQAIADSFAPTLHSY